MDLPNRHSIRLKGYDYSLSGAYFVTICTQDRQEIFGNITNEKMVANNLGELAVSTWESLPDRFPVIIDTYQIMPNHFHGIIMIENGSTQQKPTLGQIIAYFKYQSTKQINTIVGARSSRPCATGGNNPRTDGNNLITGGNNPAPTEYPKIFQRNYFEHIIRNEIELDKIREYIINNPLMWERDRNNPQLRIV